MESTPAQQKFPGQQVVPNLRARCAHFSRNHGCEAIARSPTYTTCFSNIQDSMLKFELGAQKNGLIGYVGKACDLRGQPTSRGHPLQGLLQENFTGPAQDLGGSRKGKEIVGISAQNRMQGSRQDLPEGPLGRISAVGSLGKTSVKGQHTNAKNVWEDCLSPAGRDPTQNPQRVHF